MVLTCRGGRGGSVNCRDIFDEVIVFGKCLWMSNLDSKKSDNFIVNNDTFSNDISIEHNDGSDGAVDGIITLRQETNVKQKDSSSFIIETESKEKDKSQTKRKSILSHENNNIASTVIDKDNEYDRLNINKESNKVIKTKKQSKIMCKENNYRLYTDSDSDVFSIDFHIISVNNLLKGECLSQISSPSPS